LHNAILAVQFQHAEQDAPSVEPLGRLMFAILADTMRCFQVDFGACQTAKQREFREARFWIFTDEGRGLFSFESVCDALKIDPRRVRNWLVRWQEGRLPGERRPIMRIPRSAKMAGRASLSPSVKSDNWIPTRMPAIFDGTLPAGDA